MRFGLQNLIPLEFTDVILSSCEVLLTMLIIQKLQANWHPREVYIAAKGVRFSCKKFACQKCALYLSNVLLFFGNKSQAYPGIMMSFFSLGIICPVFPFFGFPSESLNHMPETFSKLSFKLVSKRDKRDNKPSLINAKST